MKHFNLDYMESISEPRQKVKNNFLQDVRKGLSAKNKYLESKYFYDAEGDALFMKIMQCTAYYPTKCELDILKSQTSKLASILVNKHGNFDVVELGAGDASKSVYLLEKLIEKKVDFTYYPVDISKNVITQLHKVLPERLPSLRFTGLNGEYFDMLEKAKALSDKIKVVLFLGGNIGNIPLNEAPKFCSSLREHLLPGDLLLVGFDLKKDPAVILEAYNDKQGLTRDFNLNLLKRINNELGADFELSKFRHYPNYDPGTGACKSYLVSTAEQQVNLAGTKIYFGKGEPVFMEISQKYTPEQTDDLAVQAGFKPIKHFYDSKNWFLDAIWECV